MTLGQMHSEIERKLRNLDVIIDTPTSELSSIIFECEYEFIDKYYTTFEEDERSRKALSLLTIETDITPSAGTILPNSFDCVIPTVAIYIVLEVATLDGELVRVKPITLDSYRTNLNNPFKNPYSKMVWRVDMIPTGGTDKLHILVVPSGGTITNYQIGYIKEPTKYTIEDNYDTEIEIPEIFQYEIIDMVVNKFLTSNSILNSKESKN